MTRKTNRRSPKTSRQIAFSVLDTHKLSGEFASTLIEAAFKRNVDERTERSLVIELTYGIIRRQRTLDTVLGTLISRPRQRVEPQLWTLLQIGVYQLLFTRVPPHAAIFETVELAKWLGQKRWASFMNGVLRSAQRLVSDETTAEPSTSAIPIDGGIYQILNQEIFDCPVERPADYFGQAFSFPGWIARRWSSRLPVDQLWPLGFWCNSRPPVCLRVNSLKTTRDELVKSLQAADIEPIVDEEHQDFVTLQDSVAVPSLPGFDEGHFIVQDRSAISASKLLAPKPNEKILDLCAAPGTKTTHLAELMNNQGSVIASDDDPVRLPRIHQNCERLGIDIVNACLVNELEETDFDAALIDVPCSNTGVLGKRPEVRWRLKSEELSELSETQLMLVDSAARHIKPGGRMVYSTCSIEPEENDDVVSRFLEANDDWTLAEKVSHFPGKPGDGAFQALLVRR